MNNKLLKWLREHVLIQLVSLGDMIQEMRLRDAYVTQIRQKIAEPFRTIEDVESACQLLQHIQNYIQDTWTVAFSIVQRYLKMQGMRYRSIVGMEAILLPIDHIREWGQKCLVAAILRDYVCGFIIEKSSDLE